MYEYAETNWFRRTMRLSAALRPMSWFYARTLHHLDRFVYRLSLGRSTFSSLIAGVPVVMLTTTGAKTGHARRLPVLGIPHDDSVVVIASNYGQYRNPAWYHNLRANPRATIVFEGVRREVVAHEIIGAREHWYARGMEIYPGWRQYRERAAHRRIPIIELKPAGR
jgi:deazaflavin-dependent oxidoreductase (nitroreductase family)